MRIAVSQIDIAWEQISPNLDTLSEQTRKAKAQGCNLCVFPEMAACGFSMHSREMAKACASVPQHLANLARKHHIWVGTSYAEQPDGLPGVEGLPYNTFGIAGPQGQWVRYRKMHPFSLAKEQEHYQAGQDPVVVNIAGLRCALWICYDLRFANAFWSQAEFADVHLVIANWPAKRRRAWNTLLRARAIENQAYVVGCNRVGEGPGLRYCGDSCVVDPLGKTLVKASEQPALLVCELDKRRVDAVRSKLPFLADRRTDL